MTKQLAPKPQPSGGGGADAAGGPAGNTIMARLIHLSLAALKAETVEKAGTLIVNQIHTLVKTERAVLAPMTGRKRILCISGDLEPSQDNAFSQAIHEVRKAYGNLTEPRVITRETLPEGARTPQTEKVLEAMGGTTVLWFPLLTPKGDPSGYALWLERWNNRSWSEEEIRLLTHAASFFGQALVIPRKKKKKGKARKRLVILAVLLIIMAIMWIPVHSKVNAPVEVVPDQPYYVFAPFDGIVDELAVEPGERVDRGDLIFRYDTRVLEKQLEEAQQGVAVALAELTRLEGAGYADEEARAKIPVQKLEVERRQADVAYTRMLLELSDVRTEVDGVVVLDDPDALIGASLRTGEMVLSVADPESTKLKVMAPVSDAGLLQDEAPMIVRLDSAPMETLKAKVDHIGFEVKMSDDQVPSVLVEGRWTGEPDVVPGQRGVARIQGPQTPLGLQLFRKPIMSIRTMFGI